MAPTLPETNGENTNKKTGSQGREDGCENKANGNAVNVGFPGESHDHRHHQEGCSTILSLLVKGIKVIKVL
jgi:hypothetical protein